MAEPESYSNEPQIDVGSQEPPEEHIANKLITNIDSPMDTMLETPEPSIAGTSSQSTPIQLEPLAPGNTTPSKLITNIESPPVSILQKLELSITGTSSQSTPIQLEHIALDNTITSKLITNVESPPAAILETLEPSIAGTSSQSTPIQLEPFAPDNTTTSEFITNIESPLVSISQNPEPSISGTSSQSTPIQLEQFDPDNTDIEIQTWCNLTESMVKSKTIEGVDLFVALTSALKGRAIPCISKLNLDELIWDAVKHRLMVTFSRPKFFKDYFDKILQFEIGDSEPASEAGLRLWNIIERIPKTQMDEEAITGFVISILCQKDNFLREVLDESTIETKAQLFRILNGISSQKNLNSSELQLKRLLKAQSKFYGRCHICGHIGHRAIHCEKRQQSPADMVKQASSALNLRQKNPATALKQTTSLINFHQKVPVSTTLKLVGGMKCFKCGNKGHIAKKCPENGDNNLVSTMKKGINVWK